MQIYNPIRNLFEWSDQEALINKLGDPLEKINERINWELFRPELEKQYPRKKNAKGGRPRMDPVMMFKILLLQKMYGLSDHGMQYHIADRMSFQRFLQIASIKGIPDEKTIWLYREQLTKAGMIDKLFDLFTELLQKSGLIANEGKMIDASFVEAPKQRNTKEENDQIKQGEVPQEWKDNPNKMRQKDTDARWTKKNNKTYYGYKDHVKGDV